MGLQTDKFTFLRPPPPPTTPLCKRLSGMESLSSPGSRKIRHRVAIDPEIRWGGGRGAESATEGLAVLTSLSLSNL